MKFVQVQLALNYADLNRVQPPPNATLRGEYYIQLPQDSINLLNAAGNPYCLTTFLGAADLRTLLIDDFQRDILGATHQDGPFDLLEPSFNFSLCRTDSKVIYGELKSQVVPLTSATIHQQLFEVLGSGFSMEPHNVLDHIWQSFVNQDGKTICLNAQVYYITFLNAIRLFYDLKEYPIDVAGIFMDHIDPTYTKGFRAHYPNYGKARPRDALTQRNLLNNMLSALIKTKNDVSNILKIVSGAQGSKQFHLAPPGGAVPAFPSVAERTLQRYSGGDDFTKGSKTTSSAYIQPNCFGCGSPHPWSKKVKGLMWFAAPMWISPE